MRGEYKVRGGKLVAVDIEVLDGRLAHAHVSGDFFLEPDSALEDIDAALNGMPADSSAKALAGAIEATPIRFGEWTAPLHVSYGVREITPDAEPEALVAAADAAMFVRKRGARIVPPR